MTRAAAAINAARGTVYAWKRSDEAFSAAWDDAVEAGTDVIEDEATRRATEGFVKPVYQGGELVGYQREYSDTLTVLLLKGRRRAKFGPGDGEGDGSGVTVRVKVIGGLPDEEPEPAPTKAPDGPQP